ncbi:MAG TPA: bifunctional riboflavin kinase/FAD synthetase [Candidatus Polarisedimenticolia bacterium]|nr:bifunctional riboflavin kinase/FAD synthetase [Candidatus Polarisedimenticolia bacterium]
MRVFSDIPALRRHLGAAVATVGNFDGLHRGHRAILEKVLARARAVRGSSLLFTFEPHPLKILAPERAPLMITTRRQKLALLEQAGIEFVLNLPFTMELASVSAEQFVRQHLAEGLGVKEVYVGANFNFGRGRAGNADLLVRVCGALGIVADRVPEVRYLGSPVSSSRIRRAIQAGEVELARELLGRPYGLEGSVVRGEGRGAGLGFPTANLKPENDLIPQDGVYVTESLVDGTPRPAVTNIGSRPTFAAAAYAIETHLLDGHEDLYGRPIEVRFLARLRQEIRFESPQALIDQVHRDIARARDFFRNSRPRGVPPE